MQMVKRGEVFFCKGNQGRPVIRETKFPRQVKQGNLGSGNRCQIKRGKLGQNPKKNLTRKRRREYYEWRNQKREEERNDRSVWISPWFDSHLKSKWGNITHNLDSSPWPHPGSSGMQIMTQLYLKTYLTIIYMHAVISSLYGIQVSLFFFFYLYDTCILSWFNAKYLGRWD